ncbi:MAG: LysR family transcriptional regulator [Hyphomicrobiales bacterium]
MTNIPTELLRTLIAVVDLRSFTKAAQSLGVTQPAVSAQIKRLQSLLASDLLDKSTPGVSLTSAGELVVNYARRLLSINDQILDIAGPRLAAKAVRIGATGDFTAAGIALGLTCSRVRRPDLRFQVYSSNIDGLLRDLREGDADLAIWVSQTGPMLDTKHYWTESLVWVNSPSTRIDPTGPVPLVSYGDECLFTRSAMAALSAASPECEVAFVGSSLLGLGASVAAGFGVMALPRGRADIPGVTVWDDAPLPKLPDIFCGIYVRDGVDVEEREQIAETIAAALRPDLETGSETGSAQ